MKNTVKHLSAGALVLAALNQVEAQYAPPPAPATFAGFINEAVREGKKDSAINKWDIGGDVRLRFEARDQFGIPGVAGSVDFRKTGADVDNEYFLARIRLHAGYTDKWFGGYVEAQSSLAASDERAAYANSPAISGTFKRIGEGPESNILDLHQAYLTLGNLKEYPLALKAGRQELSYGEERLVGAFGWNNIGRAFDAAKLTWANKSFSVDFFTGMPVVPHDGQFDTPNNHDWLSGAYLTSQQIPRTVAEVYFLARNASREAIGFDASPQFPQPTARDIYTVGARLKSKPGELGRWDYTAEGAYQFGNYAMSAASPRLTQDAYMFVLRGGYTFADTRGTPRVALEYAYGSGDNNGAADGKHGTFDNLLPTNHKFYGYMDFASLQNLQDLRAIFQIKPTKQSSLAVEAHGFWLANKNDSFYNVGGAARSTGGYGVNPANGNYIGSEIDIVGGYALNRFTQLEAGYGHFFTGGFVEKSLAATGSRDADWVYLQATMKF